MSQDAVFMEQAIALSALSVQHGNEPFGAVLVKDGEVVATSENQIFTRTCPTLHAELNLIQQYCTETHITDLSGYTLYSSCEPCFMCSGAIFWSKISRLVYGASNVDLNQIQGDLGTETSKIVFANTKHCPQVTPGVLREEALEVLQNYFLAAGRRLQEPAE